MKLLIGIATAGSPAKPFLETLAALRLPKDVSSVDRYTVTGNFIPGQRELILRRARSLQSDFIAMFDDDMVLPPDALEKLGGALARDATAAMAGALYYARDGLRPMTVADWNAGQTAAAHIPAFDESHVTEVDGVGFGCVLIRAAVLESLPEPYVRAQVFIEEASGRARVCNEDYLFCASLRAAGYRVLLHPGVRCGHFDRATGQTLPQRWETAAETNRPRMIVAQPDAAPSVVPLDATMPQTPETHVSASLDYIYV